MKKIPTLFVRTFEGHKITSVQPIFTSAQCEAAFKDGLATIKIDGACCAIINGQLYKRYDFKRGCGKNLPEGALYCQPEPDRVTGHWPFWVPCRKDNPADKHFYIAHRNALENKEFLACMPDWTYEAIGPHFNGNPYDLKNDILIPHGTSRAILPRSFEGVKEWLEKHACEGLVFWLNGEPVCKIKRSDFGLSWPVQDAVYEF